jgi:hypothetical protein
MASPPRGRGKGNICIDMDGKFLLYKRKFQSNKFEISPHASLLPLWERKG